MVLMSKSLELLDDKKILPTEREFLLNLWRKKHGMMGENNNGTDSKKDIKSGTSLDPAR